MPLTRNSFALRAEPIGAFTLVRAGGLFQFVQPADRHFPAGAAHLLRRLQSCANRWSFGLAENQASLVFTELDAADASRFGGWYLKRGH